MWNPLTIAPRSLAEARLLAHWASQPLAATAAHLLPERGDFGHTNLGWEPAIGALTTRPLRPDGIRVGLRVADLTLLVLKGIEVRGASSLDGRTIDEALGWLRGTLSKTMDTEVTEFSLLPHDMPDHAVRDGAPFAVDGEAGALGELVRWLGNAHALLERFVRAEPTASEVRLWPHHFDIASLVSLPTSGDPEGARSINVGMSLGDGAYPEPYLYVSPWPYPPEPAAAPALAIGRWHTEGFFAAALTATELMGTEEQQQGLAEAFLAEASARCRRLLGDPGAVSRSGETPSA